MIARDLAPATIVLDDVDPAAMERTMPGGHGVLFELLNQLEGLAEDSDLLVLLTNRPDLIEPAGGTTRPHRARTRAPAPRRRRPRRLLRLYSQRIALDAETERELVDRSDGATGALIKELMRQAELHAGGQRDGGHGRRRGRHPR